MSKKDITLLEIEKLVQDSNATKVIMSLLQKGYIDVYETIEDAYKPKLELHVFLHDKYNCEQALQTLCNSLEKKPTSLNILLTYLHLRQTKNAVSQKDLLTQSKSTPAQLKRLVENEIFFVKRVARERLSYDTPIKITQNKLSTSQHDAYNSIQEAFTEKKTVLLKGITGSGKTHVYFQLIQDCIEQGKQALYLLPEIALTAQIVQRLRNVFGNRVGVYHSRFSDNERVELWKKSLQGEFDVIIGARSALLLPFKKLGIIIVDEEHDFSYKQQEPAPRYHARDAALYMAHMLHANIVLGSATPSLESYYNCLQGKYKLVELTQRYGNAILPNVTIIDTKQELTAKRQQGIFSGKMIHAMQETLQNKKQIILFQNRRGYTPFMICSSCGWVPHCKFCDVSLTYHKASDRLQCHTCGTHTAYIKICPDCGGSKISARSFGTEKIEEDVKHLFPHARVERFDTDALRIRNKHADIIRRFEQREIDILVGTQMLVKGLDFEHVQLVGVLSADGLLSYPDFRVHERAFQLLEQVSGRAGRTEGVADVYIQLFNTNHSIIKHVQQHNYEHMFREEMQARKEFQYPPYTRLIKISIKHVKFEVVNDAAQKLSLALTALPHSSLFGPATPPISRVKNKYIQEILLKTLRDTSHLQAVKAKIKHEVALLCASRGFTTVQVIIDVDPY